MPRQLATTVFLLPLLMRNGTLAPTTTAAASPTFLCQVGQHRASHPLEVTNAVPVTTIRIYHTAQRANTDIRFPA